MVGITYTPEPSGIAPYTRSMAQYLATHARSVTVMTGLPHYPSGKLPPDYRARLRTRESTQHEPVSEVPVGLMVRRLRPSPPARDSSLVHAGYELTLMANGWSEQLHPEPSLVVAVTPSLSGAVAGARLAERHGAKLLVVVQDLMARAGPTSGAAGDRSAAATAALERYALRRADQVAVLNQAYLRQVQDYGVPADRISLLRPWTQITPAEVSREQARAQLGWRQKAFTIVSTGTIGLKQDVATLVEAARLCSSDRSCRFVIVGDGSQRAHAESLASGLPNVSFVDPLDAVRYPLALAAADVLVLTERAAAIDPALPSRLTSYLCAGRPVVAAVSPHGPIARELEHTGGAGLVTRAGQPAGLASALTELRGDPAQRERMAAAAQAYAREHLGRDAALRRLDAVIARTLTRT